MTTIKRQNYDLQTLITVISFRPELFVGANTTSAVCSFINGFAFARDEFWTESLEFQKWLPKKLKYPANWIWDYGLERKYPNSEDALRELPKLYDEFKSGQK